MASFLIVELDTKAPEIEIYAPRYTTREAVNEITIQSNEVLSSYQEIYAIDRNGIRYDYTFRHEGDRLIGRVGFESYPYGISTLYARVKDEVDNMSRLASLSFEVKESLTLLGLSISDRSRSINTRKKHRRVDVTDRDRKITAKTNERGDGFR